MNKQKNLGINALLNMIRMGLSVIFPLITYPYACRVLGTDGIGKVAFTSSIINYFSLLSTMGVSSYAVREGAQLKDNKKKFQIFTNEIFTINICFTVFAYILLVVLVMFIGKFHNYAVLIAIQSMSIMLTTLGVDWINTIYEDYVYITIRSVIIRIISLILLFVLIKKPDDYYLYSVLSILNQGLVCLLNYYYCRRYIKIKITRHPKFRKHIKALVILFANQLTISIYVNFDSTMLGILKGDYYVGLYAAAVKIYHVVKTMVSAIYAVSFSRLSYLAGNEKYDEYKKIYTKLWCYISLILLPAGVGLILISKEVMLFMGGNDFLDAVPTLQILAVSLIFAIFGGLVTACLNLSIHREKDNLTATILSSVLNCGLNIIFIPLFWHNGAAFTTMISEGFVFVFCLFRVPNKEKYVDFKCVNKTISHALVASVVIIAYSLLIHFLFINVIMVIGLLVLGSIIIYVILLWILRDEYFFECIKILKNKLYKNKKPFCK